MANFEIENPVFNDQLRRLETTDPNHADTFNPNFRRLIENDAFLKKEVDKKAPSDHAHTIAEIEDFPNAMPANGGTASTISETLPIGKGGTGATTAAGARNALGLGNTSGALPVANGGTGATDAAAARNNLGAAPVNSPTFTGTAKATSNTDYGTAQLRNIIASTVDLTAGSSALASGTLYIVYE